jgi:hypothetical protein
MGQEQQNIAFYQVKSRDCSSHGRKKTRTQFSYYPDQSAAKAFGIS